MKKSSTLKTMGFAVMKLTCVQLCLTLLLVGTSLASSTAQEMLDRRVSISFDETAIITALDRLSERAQLAITYNSKLIPRNHKVSRQFTNARVGDVLSQLLHPLQISYIVRDDQVILRKGVPQPASQVPSGPAESPKEVRIQGTVTDEDGGGLPGVSIVLKGTSTGTTTDVEGNFSITVPGAESVLIFSFVGYVSQEVTVSNQTQLSIKLLSDTKALQEVVVIGYGTQKKANLTGAVASINIAEQAESRPITSLSSGLAGLASGLYVNQGNGRPGGDGATLRVRGQGTLNNSDPLVIIDGAVGNMNTLNPQDVESISVLKDAASAAIYGSRAANGVILITTKKGKEGESQISYNTYFSTARPSNLIKTVTNYADYMELVNEGFRNSDPNATPIFRRAK